MRFGREHQGRGDSNTARMKTWSKMALATVDHMKTAQKSVLGGFEDKKSDINRLFPLYFLTGIWFVLWLVSPRGEHMSEVVCPPPKIKALDEHKAFAAKTSILTGARASRE